ncbi:MAG: transketolase [Candidatus Diapherotrites archaeon]|nr:transketolase [Candidatus Diapherotrites archaeon]
MQLNAELVKDLEKKARRLRKDIVEMTAEAGSGHPGGSLSAADIVAVLYFYQMRHKPENPEWPDRDKFVLSKGHAAPVLYAALAESGYFAVSELKSLRKLGSMLQGHPDRVKIPGVEISTGSLGQGLSASVGMALAAKLDKKDTRVYCLIGDGECEEGQIWEAAMSASHYNLDNLTAILDRNKLQIDGSTKEVMSIEPIADKWKAFGWHVTVIDGHDIRAIIKALNAKTPKGKPYIIIANTTKGKGVSFMEGVVDFHGKAPTREEASKALEELKCLD